jgi:hypothetical protein
MSIKINVNVRDPATVMASFNVLRVKRSVTGIEGNYDYITAAAPAPATLLASVIELYDVAGKTLQLIRDSHDAVDILFSGLAPLTAAQVASQTNAVLSLNVAAVEDNAIRLTSTINGTASKLEIAGGSAAASFGWADGDRDIGEEPYMVLMVDQSLYEFVDDDGASGYFYKVNYYNTSNGLSSNDSSPFLGSVTTLVGADKLSVAKLDLVDASGVAVPNQDVTFYSVHDPLTVDGFQVALIREPITITTDNAGHAEIPLVRGLHVKVVFEGTSVIRDITVPDEGSFDLLTVMGTAPDPFGVATPNFPYAIRRSV